MLKDEIYKLIRTDWEFREILSKILNVSSGTIYLHATRKAPKLEHYLVIKEIMKKTGKSEEQIFHQKVK